MSNSTIPKIIHCIWLSGERKPDHYIMCINSWKKIMPEYEIWEWSLNNLPEQVLSMNWVKDAITAKKWAFAADYIRMWVLYNYGGIYLDMDVYVFKPFDVFMNHQAFSCAEFSYKKTIRFKGKNKNNGVAIEGAVIGCVKGHKWVEAIMNSYKTRRFVNNRRKQLEFILPEIMKDVSMKEFGYVETPNYQILREDVHIYSANAFSFVDNYDDYWLKRYGETAISLIGTDPIRYSLHLTLHSWWNVTLWEKIKWNIMNRLFRRHV